MIILLLLIFLFLLGIGLIYYLSTRTSDPSEIFNSNNDLNSNNNLSDICLTKPPITFPLQYDNINGVYRTTVYIGSGDHFIPFSVIPDTGSSILIIPGPECKECNENNEIWDYRLGSSIGNKLGIIKYGGGQTTTYRPWKAELRGGLNDTTSQRNVVFGVIIGTMSPDGRPVSVMGLQERKGGFLSEICGERTVTFDYPLLKLHLGKYVPQRPIISQFNLNQPTNGPAYPYATVLQMKVDGKEISSSIAPNYVIFDTGTTNTFISPSLNNILQNGKEVEFVFESRTSRDSLINKDSGITESSKNSLSFNIDHSSINVGPIAMPGAILIGNQWLKKYGISFRHEDDQFVIF